MWQSSGAHRHCAVAAQCVPYSARQARTNFATNTKGLGRRWCPVGSGFSNTGLCVGSPSASRSAYWSRVRGLFVAELDAVLGVNSGPAGAEMCSSNSPHLSGGERTLPRPRFVRRVSPRPALGVPCEQVGPGGVRSAAAAGDWIVRTRVITAGGAERPIANPQIFRETDDSLTTPRGLCFESVVLAVWVVRWVARLWCR